MNFIAYRFFLVFLTLTFISCSNVVTRSFNQPQFGSVDYSLNLPVSQLGINKKLPFQVQQYFEFTKDDFMESFFINLQFDKTILIVASSNLGQSLFKIKYNFEKFDIEGELPIHPQMILNDLQLAYWPSRYLTIMLEEQGFKLVVNENSRYILLGPILYSKITYD
ncbi:MAG: DUF3261 domain-containing protein, partial [Romboutsia sp.]|nr:DUF3261 domain-containing protein [Romboutsia sp.]